MAEVTYAYIARRQPCNCVVMATIDNPAHARDVAKEIAACVRKWRARS